MLIPNENNMIELGSSDEYDSDRIDSDVEAELYSSLHHEVIPVEAINNVSPSNKMSSNKDDSSIGEIIIISEDESDDVIPLDASNASSDRPFYLDNKGDGFNSEFPSNSFHTSFESPQRKKFKVTNLAVESGNADSKRKSDVVANLIENIQVQKQPKKKRRKSKNKSNLSNCSSRNVTIEISDSDSYRDLSDLDESGIQYIHTNISSEGDRSRLNDSVTCLGANEKKRRQISDTISLNSDSEDDSFKFEFSFDARNSSFGSSPQDLWRINDTDLYRTKRKSAGRYHEESVSQCTNCNRKGHTARYCLEPKVFTCPICGGAHSYFKCKQRMCDKCLRFGHNSKYCLLPVDQFVCSICNMRGHLKKVCPDLWRRYHLTTSGEQIRKAKKAFQEGPIYCFNCGEEGHFGFQCGRKRIENSFPTLPAVISYQHPLESLQMYTPERLPLNPPAPQVPPLRVPVPPPTVPLSEVNQTEGGNAPQSRKAKKKLKNKMKKKKEELQKRIERRMKPLLQTVPQYTPKMTRLQKNDPRRPVEDILSEIREKIKNTPPTHTRIKRRLREKMRIVKKMEKRRLAAAAV